MPAGRGNGESYGLFHDRLCLKSRERTGSGQVVLINVSRYLDQRCAGRTGLIGEFLCRLIHDRGNRRLQIPTCRFGRMTSHNMLTAVNNESFP